MRRGRGHGDLRWEVARVEHAAVAEGHRALEQVLELAHVARERVVPQHLDEPVVDLRCGPAHSARGALEELAHEVLEVGAAPKTTVTRLGEHATAVRHGPWRLLSRGVGVQVRLFHLPDDPGELAAVKDAPPEVLTLLRDLAALELRGEAR